MQSNHTVGELLLVRHQKMQPVRLASPRCHPHIGGIFIIQSCQKIVSPLRPSRKTILAEMPLNEMQTDFLMTRLPEFIQHQAKRNLKPFFQALYLDFNYKWPLIPNATQIEEKGAAAARELLIKVQNGVSPSS